MLQEMIVGLFCLYSRSLLPQWRMIAFLHAPGNATERGDGAVVLGSSVYYEPHENADASAPRSRVWSLQNHNPSGACVASKVQQTLCSRCWKGHTVPGGDGKYVGAILVGA
jgi:hypothetical protein